MTDIRHLKKIPYGVSDYGDFPSKNLYYIDKTRFIANIEQKGNYLLFIRPRRFGKSLFLSTLEYYYDIREKDQFDTLFQGTDIHKNPTAEKNSYLVLKFDFSAVATDIKKVEQSFLFNVKERADYFLTRYREFLGKDWTAVRKKIEAKNTASDVLDTLLNSTRKMGLKLYVIIDEYDNFANTILSTAGEKVYRDITHGEGFYRSFFNVLKSGTGSAHAPVSKLFISGVSPITLDDLTSGFNIATNITMQADSNEALGFTLQEVETMIHYYQQSGRIEQSTPALLEIMSRWYNGYRFSNNATTEVFNSTQVLYLLAQYLSEGKLPDELVDRNLLIDYQKIHHLIVIDQKAKPKTNGNFSKLNEIIETGFITSRISQGFPVKELVNPENFISLLFYFGLLTIDNTTPDGRSILKIPNETIKNLYYNYIKKAYEETAGFTPNLYKFTELMANMAFNGEWEPLFSFITKQMTDALGLRDLLNAEKAFQTFLNVYLGLSDLYMIHSERELNKGYADLLMEPFLAKYPGIKYSYVLEIKYISPVTKVTKDQVGETGGSLLETKQAEGETQLRQYAADKKFEKTIGQTKLVKLLLIFNGFNLAYIGEV